MDETSIALFVSDKDSDGELLEVLGFDTAFRADAPGREPPNINVNFIGGFTPGNSQVESKLRSLIPLFPSGEKFFAVDSGGANLGVLFRCEPGEDAVSASHWRFSHE